MIIIANLLGIGMMLGAVAIMAGVTTVTKNAGLGFLLSGLFMVGLDFFVRSKEREKRHPLIHPKAGGTVFFIPIWILGILPTLIGLLGLVLRASPR